MIDDSLDDRADTIEDHIGLTQSDAAETTTSTESVTTKRLFIDGGDGKEKEATVRSHHAGASSEAPASSGIPSAMTQHGLREDTEDRGETAMANRDIPTRQDLTP